MAEAYCWRTGIIEFGSRTPDGALCLARGSQKRLEAALCPIARHSRRGQTLLVPGVPEADSDAEALEAVLAFVPRVERGMQRNRRAGGIV